MSNSSYAPPGESASVLFSERTWLQGAILTGVAYGVQMTLFFMCFYFISKQCTRSTYRQHLPFLVYISAMFILGTLFMASAAEFTQLSFVDDRNFPGGPSQYETVMYSIPVDMIGNVSYSISNWLADGLMVWRCWIIFRGCRVSPWIVMLFPCLVFAGSLATGILFLVQVAAPANSPWVAGGINWTIPYYSLSLGVNIIVTIMIVFRLLLYRRRISRTLGGAHGSQYTTVAAMIVESAALYSILTLLFLILFGLANPVQNILFQCLSQIQIIAPFLIIFRVAQGKAWSSDTSTRVFSSPSPRVTVSKVSRMEFGPIGTSPTESKASSGITMTRDVYHDMEGKESTSIV